MIVSKNNSNRFEIQSIQDPGFEKNGIKVSGINGYRGPLENILGWILEIFHKAISVKTDKGTYYFNCNSLRNWFKRVMPAPKNFNDIDIPKDKWAPAIHNKDFLKLVIDDLIANKLPKNPQTLGTFISFSDEANQVRGSFLESMLAAKELNEIHSTKIFINIDCEEKKFYKDYIIKKADGSCLDVKFLSDKFDEILNEAKNFLEIENSNSIKFKWDALIKDKKGIFHNGHGYSESYYENGEYKTKSHQGLGKAIDPDQLDIYANLICKRMEREVKPQLNENKDFI